MLRLVLLLTLWTVLATAQTVTPLDSHTAENLRGVSAVNATIIWASGTHGTYLRTTDAGKSWTTAQVPGAEKLDFRDVEAFSADEAYLLAAGPGNQSRIYKTTDAGQHWSLQFTNTDPQGFYDCFAFWDRNHGIAVGDPVDGRFELLTTDDGGVHWTQHPTRSRPQALPREGAFAASGTCIAVQGKANVWFATGGKVARVFRSSNAGKTWTVADTPMVHGPDSTGIFSIAFRDSMHGVIAGGDYKHPGQDSSANLAFSNDGGLTWNPSTLSPEAYGSAAAFAKAASGGTAVLVVGTTGASYSDDIAKKSWQKTWDLNLNALSISPTGNTIAVGPNGLIVNLATVH